MAVDIACVQLDTQALRVRIIPDEHLQHERTAVSLYKLNKTVCIREYYRYYIYYMTDVTSSYIVSQGML